MALVTGTPMGTTTDQSDLYIDTAPSVWFQDATANPLNNPDADGFYWGLTGSASYPIYSLDCYEGVALGGNIEMSNIRCDTVGDRSAIQKLAYLDLTFTLKTLLPLATLTHILRGGAVTTTAGTSEKMGIGQPDNQQYWRVYFASVYDEDNGDYVCVTMHRAKFVDSWEIAFNGFGEPATLGVTLRGFADTDLPAAQQFATVIRGDTDIS
jgi:hypothetical protein